MIANDERNLKAVDSRRVAKDHPPPKKRGGKGSVGGISEILSPVTSRVTVPGTRKKDLGFLFHLAAGGLHCGARPFSGCGKSGLPSSCGFCRRARTPGASVLVAHSVAPHTRRNLPDPGWNPDPLH